MAETIGQLRIDLSADTATFVADMGKVRKLVGKHSQQMESDFAKMAKGVGIAAAAAGAAVASIAVISTKLAISFESSFAGVRKTVNATEEQFAELAKGMRDLSKEIPVNVNKLNEIGEAAGQLGIKTENILSFTRVMADLGVTTNLAGTEAATALARLANVTGLQQTEFERLGSTIVALGNNFETTEAEIVDFAQRIAGAGTQAGLSNPDILAFSTALSSVGLSAEAGGTAISKVIIQIASAVELGGKELEQFADVAQMSVSEFSELFKTDAAQAVNAFIGGLGKLEDRGRSVFGVLEDMGLTETRLRDALLRSSAASEKVTATLNLSSTAWEENTALAKEAAQRYATTESQLQLLRNQIEDLGISIGTLLLPHLRDLVARMRDWISENENFIEQDLPKIIDSILDAVGRLSTGVSETTDDVSEFYTELARFYDLSGLDSLLASLASRILSIGENSKVSEQYIRDWMLAWSPFLNLTSSFKEINDDLEAVSDWWVRRGKATLETGVASSVKEIGATLDTETNPALAKLKESVDNTTISEYEWIAATKKTKEATEQTTEATDNASDANTTHAETIKRTKKELAETSKAFNEYVTELRKQIEADQDAIDEVRDLANAWTEEARTLNLTTDELREYKLEALEADLATRDLSDSVREQLTYELQRAREALEALRLSESVKAAGDAIASLEEEFGLLPDKIEDVSKGFESLGTFVGNLASTIAETFGDLVYNTLSGQFSDLKDLFKSALKSMLRAFSDLVGALIANPIRIGLEGALAGSTGSSPGGSGLDLGGIIGSLGGVLGGIGESFRSLGSLVLGEWAGFSGFIGTLNAALPAIGLVITALSIAIPLIAKLFESKHRLDIDIGDIRDGVDKRAALVSEFLDPALIDDIVNISVKRKAGLGVGGDDAIKKLISDAIKGTIETIQTIIRKLPENLASALNESLLNTAVDIESTIKGDKLLEFDETKSIAKKFQKFLEGDLQARFLGSIRDFFKGAYESLGVLASNAEALTEGFLESLQGANRDERIALGTEFLEKFNAFVDAFNFASGRFGDSVAESVEALKTFANELGFETVPSIQEMQSAISEMIANADIDPEIVEKFKLLREAINSLKIELSSTALRLIDFIEELNAKIVSLGGVAFDTSGYLQDTIDALVSMISAGGLSFSELETALRQLDQAATMLMNQELAAAQERANAAAESARAQISAQISAQEKELALIEEEADAKIEALESLIDAVKKFRDLAEDLRNNIVNLFTGSNSVLTAIEKLNFIQSEVANAQRELALASTPDAKIAAIEKIQDLQNQLINLGASAFGTSSPEFQALFRATADELQRLAEIAEEEASKVESLEDKLDSIKETLQSQTEQLRESIASSQARLASIGTEQVQLSGAMAEKLREILEFARDEAKKLLEQTNNALAELGVDTSALAPIEAINAEQLVVLRQIRDTLNGVEGYASGSGGFRDFGSGQLAMLHGLEAVVRPSDLNSSTSLEALSVNVNLSGDAPDRTVRMFGRETARSLDEYLRRWVEDGEGRGRGGTPNIVRNR